MRLKSTGLPQIPQMVCVFRIFCLAFSYAPLFPGCLSVLVSMILPCGSSTGNRVKDYKSPCCLLSFLYQLKERRQNKKTEDPELSFCLNVFGVCFELSLNCILPHRSYCLQLSATVIFIPTALPLLWLFRGMSLTLFLHPSCNGLPMSWLCRWRSSQTVFCCQVLAIHCPQD